MKCIMMKSIYQLLVIGMLIVGSIAATAPAQDETDVDTEPVPVKKTVKKKKEVSEVEKAFKKAHPVKGKINPAAKCYVYLQSASWCPPCRAEMPEIVKAYKEMKENGVEIILCGCDRDKKGVQGYMKEFKIPFPAVVADKKLKLPGFTHSNSVPHATFVDRKGKVLKDGHGSITLSWQEVVSQIPDEEEESAEE